MSRRHACRGCMNARLCRSKLLRVVGCLQAKTYRSIIHAAECLPAPLNSRRWRRVIQSVQMSEHNVKVGAPRSGAPRSVHLLPRVAASAEVQMHVSQNCAEFSMPRCRSTTGRPRTSSTSDERQASFSLTLLLTGFEALADMFAEQSARSTCCAQLPAEASTILMRICSEIALVFRSKG